MPRRSILWPLSALLALVQLGCQALENRFVFHPLRSGGDVKMPAEAPIFDVKLRDAAGNDLHARWFEHPRETGAILYCPGNAGNLDQRTGQVSTLAAELTQSVLIVDYPGYGRSAGTPSERGCYAAAEAAFDWLITEKRLTPEQITVYGESLGGAVAVDLVSRRPARALVLARTFTSIPAMASTTILAPVAWLVHNRFDSLNKIKSIKQPIFIAYGEMDELIPGSHAQQLHAASQPHSELFTMKGLGHNDPPGPDFYAALRAFLGRLQ